MCAHATGHHKVLNHCVLRQLTMATVCGAAGLEERRERRGRRPRRCRPWFDVAEAPGGAQRASSRVARRAALQHSSDRTAARRAATRGVSKENQRTSPTAKTASRRVRQHGLTACVSPPRPCRHASRSTSRTRPSPSLSCSALWLSFLPSNPARSFSESSRSFATADAARAEFPAACPLPRLLVASYPRCAQGLRCCLGEPSVNGGTLCVRGMERPV